jgi:DNA-binding HxlR family transcriptional regulator
MSKSSVPWCSVSATVDVISGKWKPTIIWHLKDQPRRFNALRRLTPYVTQRILTLQLRELENDGIISRTVLGQVPPSVEYALTARGLTLAPILDQMGDWGAAHVPPPEQDSDGADAIEPTSRAG